MKIHSLGRFKPLIWGAEILVIISLVGSIISISRKKDIVGERRQALTQVEEKNAQLKKALTQAQSTPFIEREARDKLGLVKPGEVVVFVGQSLSTPSGSTGLGERLSRWQEWWRLFF